MGYARLREDLIEAGTLPAMRGVPESVMDHMLLGAKFRYNNLEDDTEEGYNIVIWIPDVEFAGLANSIDFDLEAESSMNCPRCTQPMDFIEVCSSDDVETKTAYACNREGCDLIVYIVSK